MQYFGKSRTVTSPAALMATARSGGTLTAVRSLGRQNIPVNLIVSQSLAAASWSRYVSSKFAFPDEKSPFFMDRLREVGHTIPGQVLLPTSDQTAWLYSKHAEELGKTFHIYQPSVDVVESLLDKSRLHQIAGQAGVRSLLTWSPQSLDELALLSPSLPYPVLIKPRSHINRLSNNKGQLTHSIAELISAYASMLATEKAAHAECNTPVTSFPVVQQFVPMGREGVHSVSGFIDRTGELFVSRISAKVFLRRYPAGVGVCYESRPANEELSQAAWKLCKTAGFYGVFEIEFMRQGDEWAVIDFNPRLFSQTGLDVARGMPLPNLLWLAAQNDLAALQQAVHAAQSAEDANAEVTLYDRFTLTAMRVAMALTSRSSNREKIYWEQWLKMNVSRSIDYAWDRHDALPGIIHILSELNLGLKALPRFIRSVAPAFSSPFPSVKAP